MAEDLYYATTDGTPFCHSCVLYPGRYRNCGFHSGTSNYPMSCKHYKSKTKSAIDEARDNESLAQFSNIDDLFEDLNNRTCKTLHTV
jgi:hypothetical protein